MLAVQEIVEGLRFFTHVGRFLHQAITPDQASALVAQRLTHREADFLAIARDMIYSGTERVMAEVGRHADILTVAREAPARLRCGKDRPRLPKASRGVNERAGPRLAAAQLRPIGPVDHGAGPAPQRDRRVSWMSASKPLQPSFPRD